MHGEGAQSRFEQAVANHLPEWGAANELVPMGLFLLSSIMAAMGLHRIEKRKLWPA